MKFIVSINQEKALRWGLTMSEAFVFAWLYELPSWAEKITIKGNDYFFASKNKACEELPAVTQKTDTMYRLYKQLERKGLVRIEKVGGNDYVMLTAKGKTWYSVDYDTNSEKNPSLGKKSEYSEKNPGKLGKKSENDSEKNPTNKYIINNNNIYQDDDEEKEEEKESGIVVVGDMIDERSRDFYDKAYPLERIAEWLKRDKEWQEAVAKLFGVSEGQVLDGIERFVGHLKANGCKMKCGADVKPHFNNWFRKSKIKGNEEDRANQGGAGASDAEFASYISGLLAESDRLGTK